MEQRFCDERHTASEKYIEARLKAIQDALSAKAHQQEERMKAKTATWTLFAAIFVAVVELVLFFVRK